MYKALLFTAMLILVFGLTCFCAFAEAGESCFSAQTIQVNSLYRDNISHESDIDCFKFTLSQPSRVNIEFTRENLDDLTDYWVITFADSFQQDILYINCNGNEEKNLSANIGLDEGTYYVKIHGASWDGNKSRSFTDDYYTLKINCAGTSFSEKEFNDSTAEATKIVLNSIYTASVHDAEDIDVYEFTLQEDGALRLDFASKNLNDGLDYWVIRIYGSDGSSYYAGSISGNSDKFSSPVLGLKAGTYFFEIKGGAWYESYSHRFTVNDYRFKITYAATAYREKEFNDYYDEANTVALAKTYYGALQSASDRDCYKLTVKNSVTVNFAFKEGVDLDDSEYYTVSLVSSADEEVLDFSVYGNSGTVSERVSLEAGIYYITVRGGEWVGGTATSHSTADYAFNISDAKLGRTSKITAEQSTTAIRLTWNKVSGAAGYRVYRKVNGKWKSLGETTKLTATIKNLTAGTKYDFAVRACEVKNKKIVLADSYTLITTATKAVRPLKVVSAQNDTAVKLKWTGCSGADGYRIYYRTSLKAAWKVALSTTPNTSYTFKNLPSGMGFQFAVRPYILTSSGVVWSDYTDIITSTAPSQPDFYVNSPRNGKIEISWGSVKGASGYQLYYKTGGSTYKLYKNYSSPQSLGFSLKSGTAYTFAVRAYKKIGDKVFFSTYEEISITVK